jgi:hypothetical protein
VSSLNAQVEEHEQEAADREKGSSLADGECPFGSGQTNPNAPARVSVAVDDSVEGLESRFGRLVIEKGRSRYINNSFWASLNNEVCGVLSPQAMPHHSPCSPLTGGRPQGHPHRAVRR